MNYQSNTIRSNSNTIRSNTARDTFTPRKPVFTQPLHCPTHLFGLLLKKRIPQQIVADVKTAHPTWLRLEQEREQERFVVQAGTKEAGQMAYKMLESALIPLLKDLELSRQGQTFLREHDAHFGQFQQILADETGEPLDFAKVAAKLIGHQHRNLDWFRQGMCNLLWRILGDFNLPQDVREWIVDEVYDHGLRIEFREGQCRVTAPRKIFMTVVEGILENAEHVRSGHPEKVECPRERHTAEPAEPAKPAGVADAADFPALTTETVVPVVAPTPKPALKLMPMPKKIHTFVPRVAQPKPKNIYSTLGDECEA